MTANYTHDARKVSGLSSCGSLFVNGGPFNHVWLKTVSGRSGDEIKFDIVVDDPMGLKSVELTKIEVTQPKSGSCEFACFAPSPLKSGDRSHLLSITIKMPVETTILEYTLKVNGQEIRIPLLLLVNEE